MARLSLYPSSYYDLIDRVGTNGKTLEISHETKGDAERMRYRFYGFRVALRKEGMTSELATADSVEVIIRQKQDGKWYTIFRPRDYNPEALKLQQALEEAK